MASIFDLILGNPNIDIGSPSIVDSSIPTRNVDFLPELDVCETSDALIIEMELAGVLKEDISIEVHDSKLIVKGEKKRSIYRRLDQKDKTCKSTTQEQSNQSFRKGSEEELKRTGSSSNVDSATNICNDSKKDCYEQSSSDVEEKFQPERKSDQQFGESLNVDNVQQSPKNVESSDYNLKEGDESQEQEQQQQEPNIRYSDQQPTNVQQADAPPNLQREHEPSSTSSDTSNIKPVSETTQMFEQQSQQPQVPQDVKIPQREQEEAGEHKDDRKTSTISQATKQFEQVAAGEQHQQPREEEKKFDDNIIKSSEPVNIQPTENKQSWSDNQTHSSTNVTDQQSERVLQEPQQVQEPQVQKSEQPRQVQQPEQPEQVQQPDQVQQPEQIQQPEKLYGHIQTSTEQPKQEDQQPIKEQELLERQTEQIQQPDIQKPPIKEQELPERPPIQETQVQQQLEQIQQPSVQEKQQYPEQQFQQPFDQPEKQEQHEVEKVYISERSFGHFKRYIDLTKILYRLNLNEVNTHFLNGLLIININKKPYERNIRIQLH